MLCLFMLCKQSFVFFQLLCYSVLFLLLFSVKKSYVKQIDDVQWNRHNRKKEKKILTKRCQQQISQILIYPQCYKLKTYRFSPWRGMVIFKRLIYWRPGILCEKIESIQTKTPLFLHHIKSNNLIFLFSMFMLLEKKLILSMFYFFLQIVKILFNLFFHSSIIAIRVEMDSRTSLQ